THVHADQSELEQLEGIGALNFLEIDDLTITQEGEPVDPASIIELPTRVDLPIIPPVIADRNDAFVAQVQASGKKWVVLTGPSGEPNLVLDADGFLRAVFFEDSEFDPYTYCHRPIVIRDPNTTLDEVILNMKRNQPGSRDEAIENDLVLLWSTERRVVTGADILGRLLDGITPSAAY
ncbi:MAG: Mg2+ and Co2+ transporter CorB, partial [Gammaproteobacteria bacterium]|nr:Mg2+ and Co2+ transporter CorB [Gammaproteobacteria bacterium]